MLDYQLFLGFPLNSNYLNLLDEVSHPIKSLFIQNNHPEYLYKLEYQDVPYLGKKLGPITDIQSIELLEVNIYSLLRRLVPHFSYEKHPLILFPIIIE